MKPISLKIKGINSYVSEQSVDFARLAESNIFGIFGETGSGKTTILDSIILALYGVSDRDSLQNIINVNTKDAYVEYVFEMENPNGSNTRYKVRRDFKLRPSGLKTEAILNDLNSKKTIAEMPDGVNTKIAVDATGVITTDLTKAVQTKQELGDAYNMVAWGGAKYEWYEQANSLAQYVIGKTAAEVEGIAVDAGTKPTGSDLASSVTIAIGGYKAAIVKAVENAKHLGASTSDELHLAANVSVSSSKNATADKKGVA